MAAMDIHQELAETRQKLAETHQKLAETHQKLAEAHQEMAEKCKIKDEEIVLLKKRLQELRDIQNVSSSSEVCLYEGDWRSSGELHAIYPGDKLIHNLRDNKGKRIPVKQWCYTGRHVPRDTFRIGDPVSVFRASESGNISGTVVGVGKPRTSHEGVYCIQFDTPNNIETTEEFC